MIAAWTWYDSHACNVRRAEVLIAALKVASLRDGQGTTCFAAVRQIDHAIVAEWFQNAPVKDVAMATIVMVRFDLLHFEKPSHGRAAVHCDSELASVIVQFHGKVCCLLVQCMAPVDPAAAEPIPLDRTFQVAEECV